METCYTNLANAIILAAAKDHRRALRRLKKYPWERMPNPSERIVSGFSAPAGFRRLLLWTVRC